MPAWLLPAAIAGGSFLLNKLFPSKPKVVPPQPPTYFNPDTLGIPQGPLLDWLKTGMIPGSGDPTVTKSFQSGSSNSVSNSLTNTKGRSTTVPIYPGAEDLLGLVKNLTTQRLNAPEKVSRGEQMGVVNSIMSDSKAAERGLLNNLSSSGGLGSPVEAGARQALTSAGLSDLAAYRTTIPNLERSRDIENQQIGSNILQGLFKGSQTDTQTSSNTKTDTDSFFSQYGESSTQGPPKFDPSFLNVLLQNPSQIMQPGMGDNLQQLLMYLLGSGAFKSGGGTKSNVSKVATPEWI